MEEYNSQELLSETENEENIINSPTEFQSDNTENYITDTDIEDTKYQPNHQIQFNNSFQKVKIMILKLSKVIIMK